MSRTFSMFSDFVLVTFFSDAEAPRSIDAHSHTYDNSPILLLQITPMTFPTCL